MKPNRPYPNLYIIGLTGTIAAGKSLVSAYLKEQYGFVHIDADIEAKKVMPKLEDAIVEAFGKSVEAEDGGVDKKKLSALVFSSQEALLKLNAIAHPPTVSHIEGLLKRLDRKGKKTFVVLEAIELLRTKLKDLVQEVWVVDAPPRLRQERMVQNRGMSEEEAMMRIRSQWSGRKYRKYAHRIIRNPYKKKVTLHRQIDEIMEQYQNGDPYFEN